MQRLCLENVCVNVMKLACGGRLQCLKKRTGVVSEKQDSACSRERPSGTAYNSMAPTIKAQCCSFSATHKNANGTDRKSPESRADHLCGAL